MNVLRSTLVSLTLIAIALPATAAPLNVGSKRFTESYILAEIIKQAAEATGAAEVSHRQGLGNTAILLSALKTGSIDIYPEYTGTIAREILKLDNVPTLAELNAKLATMGLQASVPLGFTESVCSGCTGCCAITSSRGGECSVWIPVRSAGRPFDP